MNLDVTMNPTRWLPLAALALLPCTPLPELLWASERPAHVATLPELDLAQLVPESALVYVELDHLDEVLERGLDGPLARSIQDSPLAAGLEEAWGKSPAEALAELDELVGYEVLPTLASVGADGACFAAGIDRAKPAWVLVLRGNDPDVFERALERSLSILAERAGFPGAFDAPTSHREGADHWSIGEDLHLARRGAFGVASNRSSWVERTLERARSEEKGMLANAGFARAYEARAGGELAWAWLDLERARDLQRLGGEKDGLIRFAASISDPAVQFLLGPGLAELGSASALTLSLRVEAEDLSFELHGLGIEAGAAAALAPAPDAAHAFALPRGRDNLLEAVVYRDLESVFQGRAQLFAPEVQPRFAEAESNLALFFGGADITESVLPALDPWLGVVARGITFDEGARPDVPLPALALLARVGSGANGEDVGAELVAGFQTAVGLINVDRAQKSEASMRLGLESVEGVTLTTARFRAPRAGEGVDMRYNLAPACALVGETFVIGTHARLVAELVRELQAGGASVAAAPGEALTLSGPGLAEVLRDNRELIVMNAVLNDGKTRAQAEGEHDGLTAIAGLLEHVRLFVEYPSAESVRVRAHLDVVASGAER